LEQNEQGRRVGCSDLLPHDRNGCYRKPQAKRVADTLSETVFKSVFPALADAIAKADRKRPQALSSEYLVAVREGALILLYRLLLVLYAEDRNI
jgi:hypothetical protein